MTHPKCHPPAAKLGPVIFLPPAYNEHWRACRDCADQGHMCPTCMDDLADSEAERWADGRREGQ